ncbi:Zinc finger CCCH domain-containing protein [Escovopsis weberi]|uniref:Zinc finger CCCH domain-containing protein n=1 Tax=Escovopsis weberi TaxID=150374 RepID=A0A0M9VRK4_ESCWE|nr:Zinc finger CCCH domain-containing protein [Escovopsis weberi]
MSGEDQELLARISQLAGQINRHKNQQAGAPTIAPSYPTSRYRGARAPGALRRPRGCDDDGKLIYAQGNLYRQASAPYPGRGARGYRGGRPLPPTVHRNRTLHLNATTSTSTPASGSSSPTASPSLQSAANPNPNPNPTWVSKNDRHRQLINANVYEKQTQTRAKAIEETRQRKLQGQRLQEKKRFSDYLQQNASASAAASASGSVPSGPREIEVNGVRFQVMDGGKKLVKAADDRNSLHMTPKSALIAGIKFHRTKTGNLVAARVLQDHRYVSAPPWHAMLTATSHSGTIKKVNEACKIFSTTGSCPKGRGCRYLHDPMKVAFCKDFLKDGKCANGDSCDLSHEPTPERVPNCLHYAKGNCTKPDCLYSHSRAGPGAPVCRAFGFCGYCEKGAECAERHVFECPDFANTGVCKTRGCKLLHRERASVLRNQMRDQDEMADVSSDEEMADSDDVDSDEVAEFVEADSDESDIEDGQNFIAL